MKCQDCDYARECAVKNRLFYHSDDPACGDFRALRLVVRHIPAGVGFRRARVVLSDGSIMAEADFRR